MRKLKLGSVYAITFLDHVEDSEEPLVFVVYGRVAVCGPKHIVVICWDYAGKELVKPLDSNQKYFTILQSCVKKVQKLTDV